MIQHTPIPERKQILFVGIGLGILITIPLILLICGMMQSPNEMILEDNMRLREQIEVLTEFARIHTFRG